MTFSRAGRPVRAIGYNLQHTGLLLMYILNGKPVEQRVHLDLTPCHLGGSRVWFLCPHCGRRCGKLYGRFERFLCRKCSDVDYYHSQSVNRYQRLVANISRLSQRLGGPASGSAIYDIPDKPKGMHWKTYNRLVREKQRYAEMASGMWSATFIRLQKQFSYLSDVEI